MNMTNASDTNNKMKILVNGVSFHRLTETSQFNKNVSVTDGAESYNRGSTKVDYQNQCFHIDEQAT